MTGLLLRLAAPMQSWGEHSTFSTRDTSPYPTRSGLIGLFAASLGRRRADPIADLAALAFTVRVDRPGTPMQDFHTVGGGLPQARTVKTAEGKPRSDPKTTTIVSRRFYLTDAAFTVAVTGPPELIGTIAAALDRPVWAPYLGRRSCPAEPPLLLRGPIDDPVAALHTAVPLARRPARGDTVEVDFVYEQPPDGGQATRLTLNDIPVDFHPHRRRYLSRAAHVITRQLPANLCAGIGGRYLDALRTYLEEARP